MQLIPIGSSGTETDSILGISQQIESALAVGREQIRKLRDDVLAMQSRYQQSLLEGERKYQESQGREQAAARRERILSSESATQRERADALQRDLDNALRQMDQARTETRQKIEALTQREERLKAEGTSLRGMQDALKTNIAQLQSRAAQLQESFDKARAEVELYKTSWAQVLKMERDARAYLQKRDENEAKIRRLEARNTELLSEAKSRIRELEAAKQSLLSQLEQSRKHATAAEARLQAESRAVAEERANAGCALRAAEEERTRGIQAQKLAEQLKTELDSALKRLSEAVPASPEPAAAPEDAQIEIQVSELSDDFERISSSRTQLETERDALKAQLAQAIGESERMRRNYPLRDLLAHKETELTTAVRELKKIGPDAPVRAKAEEIVEMLSEQRDQLRGILRESEARKN